MFNDLKILIFSDFFSFKSLLFIPYKERAAAPVGANLFQYWKQYVKLLKLIF